MKHANRIAFLVVVMILSVASQASTQSATDRASLESYRWGTVAAHELVEQAREFLDDARSHHVRVVESREVEQSRDKVAEEKSRIERGDRNRTDDLARAEDELSSAESHLSVTEARIVAAQSYLSASEARIISAEAVFVAAEAASTSGDKAPLLAALIAHHAVIEAENIAVTALLDITEIAEAGGTSPSGRFVFHNDTPSAVQASIVWGSAALAALAAERAQAIVDALNDGEALPPELLEPLPTEFGKRIAACHGRRAHSSRSA